jgi:hypothetical protein
MAHFYGRIQGNRGKATRCGSKASGFEGFLNGWNEGVLIVADNENGEDIFNVFVSGGSNHKHSPLQIATIKNGTIYLCDGVKLSIDNFETDLIKKKPTTLLTNI